MNDQLCTRDKLNMEKVPEELKKYSAYRSKNNAAGTFNFVWRGDSFTVMAPAALVNDVKTKLESALVNYQ